MFKLILKANIKKTALPQDEIIRKIDFYKEIQKEFRFTSEWSIFEINCKEDFDKVAFHGIFEVVYLLHSGRPNLKPSVSVNNPTWMDLWKAADQLIQESGDSSHIYIEKFVPRAGATLELVTGS